MYIFEPTVHETIWGGYRINKFYDIKGIRTGHLYMINGHDDMSSIVINGKEKGLTLNKLFKTNRVQWGLAEFEEFPLTIALVDASENLSIQVHPNEELAEELEGHKVGKIESWLFLDAPKCGWIYGGCQCDSVDSVKREVSYGNAERVTSHFEVSNFDCVTVESGTLHAMTAGALVYEIEYGSNYTYRFYDYNRLDGMGKLRELHIEKALRAINIGKKPISTKAKWGQWIRNRFYEICPVENMSDYNNSGKEMACITILEGKAFLDNCFVYPGMTILLMPGEKIEDSDIKKAVVARIVR